MPFGLTMLGVPSRVMPTKPTSTSPTLRILYGGQDRLAVALADHVGREHRVVRAGEAVAVLAAVGGVAAAVLQAQQLVDALVELVVADAGDVEAERVHLLDRGLVVEGRADQGRGADEVAGGDGVDVLASSVCACGAQLLDPVREVLDATGRHVAGRRRHDAAAPGRRVDVAVEVVERQQRARDRGCRGAACRPGRPRPPRWRAGSAVRSARPATPTPATRRLVGTDMEGPLADDDGLGRDSTLRRPRQPVAERAVSAPRRAELDGDPWADRLAGLGHAVVPGALARAAHDDEVAVPGRHLGRRTAAARAQHEVTRRADRQDRDHGVLVAGAADAVAVPGDGVVPSR